MNPIRTLPGSIGRTGRGQASPEAGVAAEEAAERAKAAMKGFWTAKNYIKQALFRFAPHTIT